MLEPCDGKLSRTVLRGDEGREALVLPDVRHEVAQLSVLRPRAWSTRCVSTGPYAGVLPSRG